MIGIKNSERSNEKLLKESNCEMIRAGNRTQAAEIKKKE